MIYERMWKFLNSREVAVKRPSFKDSVTAHRSARSFCAEDVTGLKSYTDPWIYNFFKVISGSGTFLVTCEGIPVRDLEVSEVRMLT